MTIFPGLGIFSAPSPTDGGSDRIFNPSTKRLNEKRDRVNRTASIAVTDAEKKRKREQQQNRPATSLTAPDLGANTSTTNLRLG